MRGVGSLCCSQGNAVEVARVTEQVLFKRIAPLVRFVGELHAAVLHQTITTFVHVIISYFKHAMQHSLTAQW